MEKRKSENLNNNPSDSISLAKIGSFIKEARTNKNQSIKELATSLKISEYQLKAIEDGREDLLPEKVFVNAMVRRISEELRINILSTARYSNIKRERIKRVRTVITKHKSMKRLK